jgi:hypothetical protein
LSKYVIVVLAKVNDNKSHGGKDAEQDPGCPCDKEREEQKDAVNPVLLHEGLPCWQGCGGHKKRQLKGLEHPQHPFNPHRWTLIQKEAVRTADYLSSTHNASDAQKTREVLTSVVCISYMDFLYDIITSSLYRA